MNQISVQDLKSFYTMESEVCPETLDYSSPKSIIQNTSLHGIGPDFAPCLLSLQE